MKGEDVKFLQKKLNQLGFTISTSGVGSPGNESDYFGQKTKIALIKYQNAHLQELGISVGTGVFGPATRRIIGGYFY